jgi:hypothetical protein
LELCKEDFEGAWEAEQMGDSATSDVPAEYMQNLLLYIAGKVAEANDALIWQGQDDTDEYLGYLQKMADDSGIPSGQKITGTTVTGANAAVEIAKVADAIPNAVYNLDSDLVLVCSINIGRAYQRALAGFGTSGLGAAGFENMGFVGRKPMNFEGLPMFMVGGLPANTMLAYKVENLRFGTGLLNDWTSVKVLDMDDILGSQTFRIIQRFFAGVEYGFSQEIVAYNLPAPTES